MLLGYNSYLPRLYLELSPTSLPHCQTLLQWSLHQPPRPPSSKVWLLSLASVMTIFPFNICMGHVKNTALTSGIPVLGSPGHRETKTQTSISSQLLYVSSQICKGLGWGEGMESWGLAISQTQYHHSPAHVLGSGPVTPDVKSVITTVTHSALEKTTWESTWSVHLLYSPGPDEHPGGRVRGTPPPPPTDPGGQGGHHKALRGFWLAQDPFLGCGSCLKCHAEAKALDERIKDCPVVRCYHPNLKS